MEALIVEDEREIGLMTKKILMERGINTKRVASVCEALTEIRDKDYGIYFLDLNLPDGTGFDLIPHIRGRKKDAWIVIISAYDDITESRKALRLKVNAFLKKPFSKADILNAVNHLLKPKRNVK
jgi:DNA-binding response OmpR family regulator